MIIWTQQPFKVYRKIITDGFYYCNPKLIPILQEDENFKRAYSWMIKEMHRRIGYPRQQNSYPIWGWYRSHDFKHQRPDFRWSKNYKNDVCIELDIPENQVLLSDFESWHFVLNNWYYSDATHEKEWRDKN